MTEEKIRGWEKGSANPIPDSKYERYKEKLVELSKEYPERNCTGENNERDCSGKKSKLPYY